MNTLLILYAFSATPLFLFLLMRAIRAKGKNKKLFFFMSAAYILIGQIILFTITSH